MVFINQLITGGHHPVDNLKKNVQQYIPITMAQNTGKESNGAKKNGRLYDRSTGIPLRYPDVG